MPERSFFISGHQLPLCARCTGMVAGAFIGFYLVLTGTFFPLPISIALMGPMVADGLLQALNVKKSNNLLRFFTGAIFAIGLTQAGYSLSRLTVEYFILYK